MVGLELCLLLSVLVWLLLSAPPRPSLTTTPDLSRLTDEIQGRLSGLIIDPVIEVKPGVFVRSSNVRGFHYEATSTTTISRVCRITIPCRVDYSVLIR